MSCNIVKEIESNESKQPVQFDKQKHTVYQYLVTAFASNTWLLSWSKVHSATWPSKPDINIMQYNEKEKEVYEWFTTPRLYDKINIKILTNIQKKV